MSFETYYNGIWEKDKYTFKKCYFSDYQAEYIKSNLNLSGRKILDLGCGDGRIGTMFVGNNDVYGIDLSECAVQRAQEKGITAQVGDICSKLPFKGGDFDVVLLIEVIEHVFDPLSLLSESYRILKKGGIFICTIPNAGTIINRLHFLLTGVFKDYTARFNVLYPDFCFTEHIRVFSPKIMKKLLKYYNFKVIRADYWFPSNFETFPFNKFNWFAKIINFLSLEKSFPDLISTAAFYKCQK